MCGIVGIIDYSNSGFFAKDRDMFQDLLIINSLRGSHSTGMFGGKIGEHPDYVKAVGNPYDFIQHKGTATAWKKFVNKWKFAVGHGRHATRGKVVPENAHPFQVKHITMVHNGTIYSSAKVDTIKHNVDSEALCHALAEHPANKVLEEVNGAFAIVWHDNLRKTINLARNKERPLWIADLPKEKKIVIVSEPVFLQTVAHRKGIELGKILIVPENTILTFKEGSPIFTETKFEKKVETFFSNRTTTYNKSVPPKNNVTTFPKEGRTVLITSKNSGTKIEADQEVQFTIKDIIPIKTAKGEDICHVFGDLSDFPEAEVSFVWKGKEEALFQSEVWQGKVANIYKSSQGKVAKGTDWVIYITNVSPSNSLITYDGYIIEKKEFMKLAKNGCDVCKSEIKEGDALNTLIYDDFIFCPKCSPSVLDKGFAGLKGAK